MPIERICQVCGHVFLANTAQVRLGYGKFCSQRCYGDAIMERRGVLRRFFSHVNITPSCWLWTGAPRGANRYGNFWLNGHPTAAHRFSYERFVGPIPPGLLVLHGCDTPLCVNPLHLSLGTEADNSQDMVQKRRNRTRARHPMAKLTEADVALIRAADTHRPGSVSALALRFNVDRHTIADIRRQRTWCQVA